MASKGEVILYTHRFSPYAQRVHVAMVWKDISFTLVIVDLANNPAGLLEANPIYRKVLTLVHGSNTICESLIILEYLDEAWPETTPLLPKDCLARSKARFWADYIYMGFVNLQKTPSLQAGTPKKEAAMAELSKFYKKMEEVMTEYSVEGPLFTGDKFSYLDVILLPLACWGPLLDNMQTAVPALDQLPRLNKWIKAIREHKAYKDVIAFDDKIVDFFTELMQQQAAAAAAANGK